MNNTVSGECVLSKPNGMIWIREWPMEQNRLIHGDCIKELPSLPSGCSRLVIADPPYFQVLVNEGWDNQWRGMSDYLEWTMKWLSECMRILRRDGLLYCFGQLGKREHVMVHLMSEATKRWQFHDLIIWDRAVGYNERSDSFTPAYEMILVLRHRGAKPYFDKKAVREPYDSKTIAVYVKDKRYKNIENRLAHLRRGKYATNLWRIPSLKGASKEKAGHPSQKPLALVERIVSSSSRSGDLVVDPFMGSGTTAIAAEKLGRRWVGIEASKRYCQLTQERLAAWRKGQPFCGDNAGEKDRTEADGARELADLFQSVAHP